MIILWLQCIFQSSTVFPKVFISYCWTNSHEAIKNGTKEIKGALGWADPRKFKEHIENKGIQCWMDVDRVGQVNHVC